MESQPAIHMVPEDSERPLSVAIRETEAANNHHLAVPSNPRASRPSRGWDAIRRGVRLANSPPHREVNHHTARGDTTKPDITGEGGRRGVKLPNTYQLHPTKPFDVERARDVIRDVLDSTFLDGSEYDATTAADTTKQITEAVKAKVKAMGYNVRHKLVVHAILGSKTAQGVEIGSRCLWRHDTDTSASCCYETKGLFAVVTVYGVYYE